MKHALLLLLMALFATAAIGQDWQVVRVGNAEYYPNAGDFIDEMTGVYVGNDGVVVKTSDGGQSGETLRMPDGSGIDWHDVKFANANVGYACADMGYIYKTVDGGVSWQMVADTANYTADLNKLAVVDENLVYVIGDDSLFLATSNGGQSWTRNPFNFDNEDLDGGIAFLNADTGVVAVDNSKNPITWYTHDGGQTWNAVMMTFPPGTISPRIYDVDAAGNTIVMVGYHYCIFVSTDGGQSYNLAAPYNFGYEQYRDVQILDDNTIIAGGSDGFVMRTDDAGATWDTLHVGNGETVVFVDFVTPDVGYVFSYYGQWNKTTDGGQTWTPLLEWPNISFWGLSLPSDQKIALSSWGGGEFTMSNDGGQTWTYPSNYPTGTPENLYECEFIDENTGFVAGSYGELRKTTDGGNSFTFIDNPFYQNTNKHINALRILNENTILAGGSSGMIMKSEDAGDTWVEVEKGGTKTVYDLFAINEHQVIAAASSGQIYLSNTTLDTFTLAEDYGSMSMRAVEFRGDVGLVVASSGYIYRTSVARWDTLSEVFQEPNKDDFYDLEFVTDSLVYAVGEHGIIYKSMDAGLTWIQEFSPTEETLQKVRYRNNRLWAVGKNGTVLLLDMTPETALTGLYINEFMPDNMAAFQDTAGEYDDWIEIYNANAGPVDMGGLYLSDNKDNLMKWMVPDTAADKTIIPGGGWMVFWADEDQPQGVLHTNFKLSKDGEFLALSQMVNGELVVLDSLSFGPINTDIAKGRSTDGGPDWVFFNPSTPGSSNSQGVVVRIEHNSNSVVYEYRLDQNYPNPFNPVTTIEYTIKKAGRVKLAVYSVTGQKVATLIDKKMSAGKGRVTWNAASLASGVYFYKLESGDYSKVRKLMLLK